jgi:hypothetical protein
MRNHLSLICCLFAAVAFSSTQARAVQLQSRHNNIQAFNLANEALIKCYRQKDLRECYKLEKIKQTLFNWCDRGDAEACSAFNAITSIESNEMISNSSENVFK